MFDIEIELEDRPGAMADFGETLGRAGISVEGGGMWVVDGVGVAHFLVEDGPAAHEVLLQAGFRVLAVQPVLLQRLAQDRPGQLGAFCRAMERAGVNIEVLYSDHDHRLVVVVDDPARGAEVSQAWL